MIKMEMKYLIVIMLAVLGAGAVCLMSDGADYSDAATGTYTDGNFTFDVVDGNASIISFTGTGANAVNIPSTVSDGTNTYPVTEIGNGTDAIFSRSQIVSGCTLSIPDSVVKINNIAFNYHTTLDARLSGALVIPDSVIEIGANAFWGCKGFTSIDLGDGVQTIGNEAFKYCKGFANLSLPNSLVSIGNSAFEETAITSLDLGYGLQSIGTSAFRTISTLTGTLTIPDTVVTIGNYAFSGDKCTTIDIGSGIQSIGTDCFYIETTTELIVRGTPTTIGNNAFLMTALETVYNLGENDTIVAGAYGIPSTATVLRTMQTFTHTISDGVAIITGTTGDGWETVEVPSTVTDGGVDYPVVQIGDGTNAIITNNQLSDGATLVIPDGVTTINPYAFERCYNLTGTLDLPDTLVTIGDVAFYACSGLTGTLTIPVNVTSIGRSAFMSCTGFTGLVLNDGLTTIGYQSFMSCNGITGTLDLPDTLVTIGNSAFRGTNITGTLDLPDTLVTIGENAYWGCAGLNGTLTIPVNVTSIGLASFSGTRFDTVVILADNLTIGAGALPSISGVNVLNLSNLSISAGQYGLASDAVVLDYIPGSSYIAPTSITETVQNDGPVYDVLVILPLLMILGVVIVAVYSLRDKF